MVNQWRFYLLLLPSTLLYYSCQGIGKNEGVKKEVVVKADDSVAFSAQTEMILEETSKSRSDNSEIQTSNLLKNPAFEEGNKYWAGGLKIDKKIRRSGSGSAFYSSSNGAKNKSFSQSISGVNKGDVLVFSGWIKGLNIITEDLNSEKGAAIFIQGYNAFGKYIKGEFSTALTGSFDWKFVKGIYVVPEGVSSVKFGFFLRHKSKGKVWFDDLSVSRLQSNTINSQKSNMASSNNTFKNTNRSVYIDDQGFTVKNGIRFFPLILFVGEGPKSGNWASSDDNLKRISSTGFNTVMSYYYGNRPDIKTFFNTAKKHNLNVVFNLKDLHDGLKSYRSVDRPALSVSSDIVNKFKDESNLLAWYINDELGLGKLSSIEALYNTIVNEDKNHPVFQVENNIESLKYLKESSDVIGTDPYPVVSKNIQSLKQVSNLTRETVKIAGGRKGVWQVMQLVDLSFANKREARAPSLQEIRNMCFQAIISGAKGLAFYNYHWLWYGRNTNGKKTFSEASFSKRWSDIQVVMKEINLITPIILKNNITSLKTITEGNKILYKCFNDGDKYILLVTNPINENNEVTLELPSNLKIVNKTIGRNSEVKSNSNKINLKLRGLESGFVILQK